MSISQRSHRIVSATAVAVCAVLASAAYTGPSRHAADPMTAAAHPPVAAMAMAGTPPGTGAVPGADPPTAGAALGALPQEPFPGDAALTDPDTREEWPGARSVTGAILPAEGLRLGDGWYHSTDRWNTQKVPPASIGTGVHEGFMVEGVAPGMVASYQIYDAANKPTGFWIGAKFYSPAAGTNKWSCEIYHGDPRSDEGEPTRFSTYTCAWSNYRGWEPAPVLTISTGTVVTSKAQAKKLLLQYCNDSTAARKCEFINFGYGTTLGDFMILGQRETNTSDSLATHVIGGKHTVSSRNSVGVETSVEVKFWDVWKASLTAKYEHTWEESHEFEETTKAEIEPHSVSWLEFAPRMGGSEGTWVINTGDQRYVIPQVSVTAPLRDGGQLVVYGCPLAHYRNDACEEGLTTTVVHK